MLYTGTNINDFMNSWLHGVNVVKHVEQEHKKKELKLDFVTSIYAQRVLQLSVRIFNI